VAETPTILLTSADIQNIEHERTRINAEIVALEAKLPELHARQAELAERLAKINSLLDALGLGSVNELSSNSVYAARHVRTTPSGHSNGTAA
jgi:peptidoglycan hydrolase CwlO-like protein